MHTPVMLDETIRLLNVQAGKKYVDATYGLGGHSNEIRKRGGIVLALEWDVDSYAEQSKHVADPQITLVHANYADIASVAHRYDFADSDGVLFDYGLSMWQIRESGRGFSYEKDEEMLDMRIDSSLTTTASDIVTHYSEDELYEIFTRNAEEIHSRAIAHAFVQSRRVKAIKTVGDARAVIQSVTRDTASVARIFQALRIEVNNEYAHITQGLNGALTILAPGGRIVTITFHPSEDRLVKKWAKEQGVHTTGKALKSTSGRSFERSALLRVMTKRI